MVGRHETVSAFHPWVHDETGQWAAEIRKLAVIPLTPPKYLSRPIPLTALEAPGTVMKIGCHEQPQHGRTSTREPRGKTIRPR